MPSSVKAISADPRLNSDVSGRFSGSVLQPDRRFGRGDAGVVGAFETYLLNIETLESRICEALSA
jgi:hypothetical protein